MNIKCKICQEEFSDQGLPSHYTRLHGIDYKLYYDKMIEDIANSETGKRIIDEFRLTGAAKPTAIKLNIRLKIVKRVLNYANISVRKIKSEQCTCFICNQTFARTSLSQHVRTSHSMSFVNYRHDLTVFRLSTNYGKSIVSDYKNGVALRALVCQYGKLHQLKKIDIREMLTCAGFEIRNPQCYLLKSRCQWYLFNGRYFQGTWELRYAIWLTANNVTFKSQKEIDPLLYELNGKQHLYYPDFYLPSLNRYIEIKGRYKARDKIKMDVIKHVYAKHEFLIITQADLKAQGIWNFYKQQNINFTDYVISADNKQRQIDLFLKNNDKQHVLASFNEEFQSISGHKSTRIKFALRRLREKYNVSVDVIKRVFEIWSIAKEGSGSFISRMPFCTRLN